jgi:hypothetical protein
MLKIKGTEVQQALTELMFEAIGPQAAPFDPRSSKANANTAWPATTMPHRLPRTTSTSARRRSTAARTKFKRTSSRR